MRLVTRGDLDGLTCAVLITSCEDIDEIVLVHPQDITDKRLHITDDDIIANLPYQTGVGKWFDHHLLTAEQRAAAGGVRRPLRPGPQRRAHGLRVLRRAPPRPPALRAAARRDGPPGLRAAQRSTTCSSRRTTSCSATPSIRARGSGDYQSYFRKLVGWLKTAGIDEVMRPAGGDEPRGAHPRPGRRVPRAHQGLLAPGRQRRLHRLPRREPAAGGQPLPRLHAVPGREHLPARALGAEPRARRGRGRATRSSTAPAAPTSAS